MKARHRTMGFTFNRLGGLKDGFSDADASICYHTALCELERTKK